EGDGAGDGAGDGPGSGAGPGTGAGDGPGDGAGEGAGAGPGVGAGAGAAGGSGPGAGCPVAGGAFSGAGAVSSGTGFGCLRRSPQYCRASTRSCSQASEPGYSSIPCTNLTFWTICGSGLSSRTRGQPSLSIFWPFGVSGHWSIPSRTLSPSESCGQPSSSTVA